MRTLATTALTALLLSLPLPASAQDGGRTKEGAQQFFAGLVGSKMIRIKTENRLNETNGESYQDPGYVELNPAEWVTNAHLRANDDPACLTSFASIDAQTGLLMHRPPDDRLMREIKPAQITIDWRHVREVIDTHAGEGAVYIRGGVHTTFGEKPFALIIDKDRNGEMGARIAAAAMFLVTQCLKDPAKGTGF